MPSGQRLVGQAAPVGSVGNNTHASVVLDKDAESLALEFKVEAVGATPTITFLWQASDDDAATSDANSDWYPFFALPSNGAAEISAGGTVTAVGISEFSVELARRPMRKVRLVTSLNTNVTYSAQVHEIQGGAG